MRSYVFMMPRKMLLLFCALAETRPSLPHYYGICDLPLVSDQSQMSTNIKNLHKQVVYSVVCRGKEERRKKSVRLLYLGLAPCALTNSGRSRGPVPRYGRSLILSCF
ncbi:hypothetical protein BD289DRAFT_8180 [Coniella lustricola]|uniref:Secreted protein n=1 Tax=Coniella lustricola TaxID=2025994 RepID=A0A2T3AJV4_9PEZI|nr:hypothetical protein BD289DRAFT_8180 [Coniella lustricola]